jgi:DNA polymerase III sliding clamp (beta) subunit (PCNA family)
MEFKVQAAQLKEALDLAKPLAIDAAKRYKNRRSRWAETSQSEAQTPEELGRIQLLAEEGQLRVVVDHEDVWVVFAMPVKARTPGSVSIKPSEVTAIGRLLTGAKDAEVLVSYGEDQHSMRLAVGTKLTSVTADSAKKLTVPAAPKAVEIQSGPFIDIIEATRHAVGTEEACDSTSWRLCSFFIEHNGSELRAATTDGHRLAVAVAKVNGDLEDFAKLVPAKAVDLFRKFLGKSSTIRVGFETAKKKDSDGETQTAGTKDTIPLLMLGCDTPNGSEVAVYVKKTQGEFPPYRKMIPSGGQDISIRLAMPDALNVLVPITAIVDGKNAGIHIQNIDGRPVVWRSDYTTGISVSGDLPGQSVCEAKGSYSGTNPQPVVVRAKYFTEALQAITSNEAVVEMNSRYETSPILITGRRGVAQVTCAIMPMRRDWGGEDRRIASRPGPNPPPPIPVAKLANALSFVSSALELKSASDIFASLRVQYTHEEALDIDGTDSHRWAGAKLPVAGSHSTEAAIISAKLLSDIVSHFSTSGSIIVKVDSYASGTIKSAVCLYDSDLPLAVELSSTIDSNDYPPRPVFTPVGTTNISCAALQPLLKTALPIVSDNEQLPHMNSMEVNSGPDTLMVRATYGGAAIKAWTPARADNSFSTLVPRTTVVAVLKMLSGDFAGHRPAVFASGTIGYSNASEAVQAGSIFVPERWPGDESRYLIFKAGKKELPDIERVMSRALGGRPAGSVDLDRKDLMDDVRLLAAGSDATKVGIILEQVGDKLQLSRSNDEKNSSVQLNAKLKGHIGMVFLADSLLIMSRMPSSKRITFSLHNNDRFALLRGQSSPYVSFDFIMATAKADSDAPPWDGKTTDPLPAPPDPIEAPLTEDVGVQSPKRRTGKPTERQTYTDVFEKLTSIDGDE